MEKPPRKRDVRLLDFGILGRASFVGTIEGALPMLFAFAYGAGVDGTSELA